MAAARLADLCAGFDRSPAYAGLAETVRRLITDGRIPYGCKLPGERDLSAAMGLSRTTVTRAYAVLHEAGYARTAHGSGTFATLPGGRRQGVDRALTPHPDDEALVDLNCAAPGAPPGLMRAYEEAVTQLPAYFGGHGYYPTGLPELRAAIAAYYATRGLPTDPDQIMVTPGALAATAVVAGALTKAGDRVLCESPVYPNAPRALAIRAARLVSFGVGPDGWDTAALGAALRQSAPALAYLIPDLQNPTGHLLGDRDRARWARLLAEARCLPVIDESHAGLLLDSGPVPRPFAAHVEEANWRAVTVGSLSKSVWGGLRVGWLRAPTDLVESLLECRLSLDLGVPVVEQLVATALFVSMDEILTAHLAILREQRAALVDALRARLPQWRFRVPVGGLALWVELPEPLAVPLAAAAEERGVIVTPGPVFAVAGGLGRYVRIPWTRPVDELRSAVEVLEESWYVVPTSTARRSGVLAVG